MLLAEKTAIVTGASRGIGLEIARVFVENGASVVVNARSNTIHDIARQLTVGETSVVAVQGDLADESCVREIVQVCKREFNKLDILVNNAGILIPALLGMISMAAAREMFEVNVLAPMNLTQYAVRLMQGAGKGSIINLGSIAGSQTMEGVSAYGASKAAIIGFTRSVAKELAPKGIRANAIAPGFIDTDMTRSLDEEWFQLRTQSIRLGRIGTPRDVANLALFLASDLSSYITGQTIGVDGGMQV
jgi:3-oxoacyl-[acyl-carrier protein] reductase